MPIGCVIKGMDGFADYVAAESSRLLRSAWLLTGDWLAAEDLVQEALVRAWPKWESIQRRDEPGVYVRRVLLNVFLNDQRRHRFHLVEMVDTVIEDLDAFDNSDDRDLLRRALATLPPRQRAVVVLRYLDDYSEQQAAVALGCSIGTVKSSTAKALRTLREIPGLSALATQEKRS